MAGNTITYTHDSAGKRLREEIREPGAPPETYTFKTEFEYDVLGRLWRIILDSTPIAKAFGQDLFFIHTDLLATPKVMTDTSGISVWELDVRPFGDNENVSGTETLNIRFPGQYYDSESGMNYNYFRTYKYDLGRYLERPIRSWRWAQPFLRKRGDRVRIHTSAVSRL